MYPETLHCALFVPQKQVVDLYRGYQLALDCITVAGDEGSLGISWPDEPGNYWTFATSAVFGDQYLLRAAVSYKEWGINPVNTSIYIMTTKDEKGEFLTNRRKYKITFSADEVINPATMPAKYFYSITMYR